MSAMQMPRPAGNKFYDSVRAKARTFSGAPMGINAYSILVQKEERRLRQDAGWVTDSQIVLPTALKARCNKPASQFKPRPHAERQQNANTNRAQFIAERVAKGPCGQLQSGQRKGKEGMMQAEGFFSVNACDANDNNANAGWGVRTRLPKRLAMRNNKLQQQFKKAPYTEREREGSEREARNVLQWRGFQGTINAPRKV